MTGSKHNEALEHRIDTALAVLADALDRCEREDMRTDAVFAALDFLSARSEVKWPFENFRRALDWYQSDETRSQATGRWQNVNASLNGIRRAVAGTLSS